MTADHRPPTGLDRRDLLRLGGLIAALLVLVGGVLLLGGGGGESSSQGSRGQMRGILTTVTDTQLTLRTDAGDTEEFVVRPEDRRNLDLFHLQTHAADALPSIVHYEEEGDRLYAVRVDDA